jgi:hypothetical protein
LALAKTEFNPVGLILAHRRNPARATKPHEAFAVEPESRELVADALFRLWHGSPDYFSKSLKRRSLVIPHRGELLVDVFRFYNHGLCS